MVRSGGEVLGTSLGEFIRENGSRALLHWRLAITCFRKEKNVVARIPIALQLYSVREACAEDLPGTVEAVAQMGYDGVEFHDYCAYSAQELHKMLNDNGLECCGSHLGIDQLLGDELMRAVEFSKELGTRFLICPALPEEYRNGKSAWQETAQLFNEISARVRPLGMWIGYHNHRIEFTEMDGELPWDIFFGNTSEEVVIQLDTGHALAGGADPAKLLGQYPGRALTVHLKEHSAINEEALIGEGDVCWEEIFRVCESPIGATQWYIVEQETYPCPPLEAVEGCLRNLREMGK